MKRWKVIKIIADNICHDPFAYNPKWKWTGLPEIIKVEYTRILPILKLWEEKKYITLVANENIIFIVHPENLPNKEELIEESKLSN